MTFSLLFIKDYDLDNKSFQVRIRRGEFFEGEEKENSDGDVIRFDAIKDIRMHRDTEGFVVLYET